MCRVCMSVAYVCDACVCVCVSVVCLCVYEDYVCGRTYLECIRYEFEQINCFGHKTTVVSTQRLNLL